MYKYYLYDIQNDERIYEVDFDIYYLLENAIFNMSMLQYYIIGLDEIHDAEIMNFYKIIKTVVKKNNEKIFKIIKVEVD